MITLLKSYSNQYDINESIENLENNLLYAQVAAKQLSISDLAQSDPINANWTNQDQDYFTKLGYYNPFLESRVIIASQFFKEEIGDPSTAYDILLKATEINPYSAQLLKAYIEAAISTGLENYADQALIRLSELVTPAEFESFEKEVEDAKDAFNDFTFPGTN